MLSKGIQMLSICIQMFSKYTINLISFVLLMFDSLEQVWMCNRMHFKLLTLTLNAKKSSCCEVFFLCFTFLPLDALLLLLVTVVDEVPLSEEFFLSTAFVVGGWGAAFFLRLRPNVPVFFTSFTCSALMSLSTSILKRDFLISHHWVKFLLYLNTFWLHFRSFLAIHEVKKNSKSIQKKSKVANRQGQSSPKGDKSKSLKILKIDKIFSKYSQNVLKIR